MPDGGSLPIVDPRGLLTPLWDGWSLDAWVIGDDGRRLLPSRAAGAEQRLDLDELQVVTAVEAHELALTTRIDAVHSGSELTCRLEAEARSARGGWLVLALRPYNPEGVSLVHEIRLDSDRLRWRVEGHQAVTFSNPVERHHASNYRSGDVLIHLDEREEEDAAVCEVGMATTAAMFGLNAGQSRRIGVRMDLENHAGRPVRSWSEALQGHCRLSLPDERAQFLYDAALRTLVLLSPDEVYAGPYTYRSFWFRDAAFILHSLLCMGLFARCERAIDHFPSRQARDGYFRSQDGEWDANGEVLWLIDRYCGLSGRAPKAAWRKPVGDGAAWLARKRLPEDGSPHAGLLPAGFSAEHLGPNDYYYWDDFWGIAGLEAAARLMERYEDEAQAMRWAQAALALRRAVERSIDDATRRLRRRAIAASPYRRMDSAVVGSLVAGYPLQLFPADDPRRGPPVDYLDKPSATRTPPGGQFFVSPRSHFPVSLDTWIMRRAGRGTRFGIASPTRGFLPTNVAPRLVLSLALPAMLAACAIGVFEVPIGRVADTTVPGDVEQLQIGQSRRDVRAALGGDPLTLFSAPGFELYQMSTGRSSTFIVLLFPMIPLPLSGRQLEEGQLRVLAAYDEAGRLRSLHWEHAHFSESPLREAAQRGLGHGFRGAGRGAGGRRPRFDRHRGSVDSAALPGPRLVWEADTVSAAAQGTLVALGEAARSTLTIRDLATDAVIASTTLSVESCGAPAHTGWLPADGGNALIVSADGVLCLWNRAPGEPPMPLSSDGDPQRRATRVALARGAPVAATYDAATRSVNIWDTQAGALRSTRPVGDLVALALGSRGERLAIIDHEMKLLVLSTASGEELARAQLSGPRGAALKASYAIPSGEELDRAQLDRRRPAARKTIGLAMAPDQTTIAVNRVTHVEIWRLTAEERAPENLRLERVLLLPVATLDCRVPVAFSADGSRLAAGCDSAVVWETNTWRELVRLVPDAKGRIGGAPAWIDEGFAFSADGRAVLTTHGVWDVPDPAPAATE